MIEKFNIDLIEVYSYGFNKEKKFETGSVHIYVEDFDLDIRGLEYVRKSKTKVRVRMPTRKGKDKTNGNVVLFPLLDFANRDTKKLFLNTCRKAIEEFFKEGGEPETELHSLNIICKKEDLPDDPKPKIKKPYKKDAAAIKKDRYSIDTTKKTFTDYKPKTSSTTRSYTSRGC